jgi:hypothetical protein
MSQNICDACKCHTANMGFDTVYKVGDRWLCPDCVREELEQCQKRVVELQAEVERLRGQ